MAAEIPDGAVLVARAILNSSLWTMLDSDRLMALTCICIANWKDRKIWFDGREVTIRRGQFVRSRTQLVEASRLSEKQVRGSIIRLIRAGFMARERAGQSYIYTICKYDVYQDLTKYSDREWATEGQVSGRDQGRTRAKQGPEEGQVRAGRGPVEGHKQEGEEGEERKKGEEARASSDFQTTYGRLAAAAKRNINGTFRLETWIEKIRGAHETGASLAAIEAAVMDPARRGAKPWDLLDALLPQPAGGNGATRRNSAEGARKWLREQEIKDKSEKEKANAGKA